MLIASMLLVAAGPPIPRTPPPIKPDTGPVLEQVSIRDQVFRLKVAATDQARATGLMGVREIEPLGGMLFIFPGSQFRSFWMANCLVDMDLIFLDGRGRIVAMHEMVVEPPQANDEPEWDYYRRLRRYTSRRPAQFAIELKAGSIKRLKLDTEEVIELDLPRLKKMARPRTGRGIR